jgi:hypothetical protein
VGRWVCGERKGVNMFINGRLVVKENDMDNELRKLENQIEEVLAKHNLPITVHAEFNEDCFNEETKYFWKEIDINLHLPNGMDSYIVFSTESLTPNLVYVDGKFEFYYILENSESGCTNPVDWRNTGFSEFKCNKTIEQIIEDELWSR